MGSGFRTFTAGEVLTASNVQNYLQDQVVMTFAGSAARSSAIGTANFEEGMVSYLTDTDKVEAYNGTNWVQVGSSNQGLTLINTTSFSGVSSQSINDVFSSTYDNYVIFYKNTTVSGTPVLTMRYRLSGTDTSANYGTQRLYAQTTAVSANRDGVGTDEIFISDMNNTTPTTVGMQMNIFNPNVASPTLSFISGTTLIAADLYTSFSASFQSSSTQFTGFTLLVSAGTFGGTVSVYGLNKQEL